MKRLFAHYGQQIQFVDIIVRQAHPGERRGPYRRYDQKLDDAREYQRAEAIPWPVLVDDLAGTTHLAYGGMSDPIYLIDATGRVSFYNMWAHIPSLKTAIDELLNRDAQSAPGGPVAGGIDRVPHLTASFVNGWHGLRRGGWGAVLDYELGTPGASTLTFLGNLAKPLLAPLALRTDPLSVPSKLALGGGLIGAGILLARTIRRRDE